MALAAVTSIALPYSQTFSNETTIIQKNMYGLIGKITAYLTITVNNQI